MLTQYITYAIVPCASSPVSVEEQDYSMEMFLNIRIVTSMNMI